MKARTEIIPLTVEITTEQVDFLAIILLLKKRFMPTRRKKRESSKQGADQYKDKIPQKLYDVMYRYEVEITD